MKKEYLKPKIVNIAFESGDVITLSVQSDFETNGIYNLNDIGDIWSAGKL